MSDHADIVREALECYYRVTGGDGDPNTMASLAALDALVAERDEWQMKAGSWRKIEEDTLERLGAVEDEREAWKVEALHHNAEEIRLREALAVYDDGRNWAISRDDLNHRVVSWVGPGAIVPTGVPDAPAVARAALYPCDEGRET